MSWQNALVTLASTAPDKLPKDVHLTHDEHTITIFDKFPKARFHFLTLPRLPLALDNTREGPVTLNVADLSSLESLSGSEYALNVLRLLEKATEEVVAMIEIEMMEAENRTWQINIGFHAVESMKHLHLHIISSDLISDKLKHKKHYNSFRPDLGFFLHLKDVISWAASGTLKENLPSPNVADDLLKTKLMSFRSKESFSNIPKLKSHLIEVHEADKEKASTAKRKAEGLSFESSGPAKRTRVAADESEG